jgi:hypothetical protein
MLISRLFQALFLSILILINVNVAFAHCDTMDGPVVSAGRKALEKNNVNYALIWVKPESERQMIEAFELAQKVRPLNPDARKLADTYFFETLVRLHRMGEGIAYTGIKPSGTPVDKKILAADRSLELGNLSPLEKMVPSKNLTELSRHFKKALSLKNYDVNDVIAGRQYVEAYVQFFHFAEGGEKDEDHESVRHSDHTGNIP